MTWIRICILSGRSKTKIHHVPRSHLIPLSWKWSWDVDDLFEKPTVNDQAYVLTGFWCRCADLEESDGGPPHCGGAGYGAGRGGTLIMDALMQKPGSTARAWKVARVVGAGWKAIRQSFETACLADVWGRLGETVPGRGLVLRAAFGCRYTLHECHCETWYYQYFATDALDLVLVLVPAAATKFVKLSCSMTWLSDD